MGSGKRISETAATKHIFAYYLPIRPTYNRLHVALTIWYPLVGIQSWHPYFLILYEPVNKRVLGNYKKELLQHTVTSCCCETLLEEIFDSF